MENDFLRELEFLGVTARLKRLSDALSVSIKELYRTNGVDFEPSWHLVLLFLQNRTATPTEIATALKLSQPAVTTMLRRMVAKGYLDVIPDHGDGRKKNVQLSAKARDSLPALRRVWAAGEVAIREILGSETAFLGQLKAFENQIDAKSFVRRAVEHLDHG